MSCGPCRIEIRVYSLSGMDGSGRSCTRTFRLSRKSSAAPCCGDRNATTDPAAPGCSDHAGGYSIRNPYVESPYVRYPAVDAGDGKLDRADGLAPKPHDETR